jgi:vancomycin resistance protein YoaR
MSDMDELKPIITKPKRLLQNSIFGASIVIVLFIATFFCIDLIYRQRVLPNVAFAGVALGGESESVVRTLISAKLEDAKLEPITLQFDGTIWTVNPEAFNFKLDVDALTKEALLVGRSGNLQLKLKERFNAVFGQPRELINASYLVKQLDHVALNEYLATIAKSVDQEGRDAKLTIKNNHVTEFVSEQTGHALDVEKAIALIAENLLKPKEPIKLPVKVTKPTVTLASTNKLGINTLIAQGVSDFSGSPSNRRHNIATGARRFDGLIVKPDETFSFVRNLGDVDAKSGYLPELVIKGDETIPEYGGGLCQVSTTAFRAILNGGLPVTERRNHSYRVAYYEPAGTDATIYQPYPDLKFKNDTGAHLFMDTYIEGNKLYFDFYGTDTKRVVEMDGPHIYNVTSYPEPIYIDTSTIEPGKTKQIDSAHRGADAVLYRKVYQDGKIIIDDTFKSHYIPWPAKFLRGVEEAAAVETDLANVLPEDTALEKPIEEVIPTE